MYVLTSSSPLSVASAFAPFGSYALSCHAALSLNKDGVIS